MINVYSVIIVFVKLACKVFKVLYYMLFSLIKVSDGWASTHLSVDLWELFEVSQLIDLNVVMGCNKADKLIVNFLRHESQGKTIRAETACTAHAMQEILIVWVEEAALISCWNVIVHNQVDLRDVNTSCQYICRNKSREVLLSEVVNDLITLVTLQTSYQDLRLDIARL